MVSASDVCKIRLELGTPGMLCLRCLKCLRSSKVNLSQAESLLGGRKEGAPSPRATSGAPTKTMPGTNTSDHLALGSRANLYVLLGSFSFVNHLHFQCAGSTG